LLIYDEQNEIFTFLNSTFRINNFNKINLRLQILNSSLYKYIDLKLPIKIFQTRCIHFECIPCVLNNNNKTIDDDIIYDFPFVSNGIEHYYSKIQIINYNDILIDHEILIINYKKKQ
jgi:hypothetical protein